MSYITNTALKTYLDITSSGDDTLLTSLITRTQAMIDAYCRQTFEASSDTTRYFDPTRDVNGRTLFLDYPLAAITSVTNGDSVVVSSGDYVTEPRNETPYRRLTLKSNATVAWTYSGTPENAIAIVGKWTYSATAPDDIVQACTRLAAYLYRQRDNALDLDRTVIVGDATILPVTIPRDVQFTLRPYRRLL